MPFTKFTDLDFDQIKESIRSYLRANSDFSGFDFEGSNFSVLIDTLAYNTYITAFNSNMVVNESFLDSATLRENVVSLARNIGYVPKSRTAAKASVTFTVNVRNTTTPTFVLKRGLVCVGNTNDTAYTFSVLEDVQLPTTVTDINVNGEPITRRTATFENLEVLEGTYLEKQFVVDSSLDQRFILDNPFIDTSTIKVYVKGEGESGLGTEYALISNIKQVIGTSEVYLLQEIQDEKYQLLFGDGLIGKKLETGQIITVNYLVTDGKTGNGATNFSFSGRVVDSDGNPVSPEAFTVTTLRSSQNGSDIENIDSIKYFAPRIYSSQNRAVTARDYETIVKTIYPDTESVAIVGGEELDPPQFGTVQISIKPKNGFQVSDFNKSRILSKLKQYSISGINQKIVDLKLLYVEADSYVYYNDAKVSTPGDLKAKISNSLTNYSNSTDLNKFGGRFRYSKVQSLIDGVNSAITSNITTVRMRRNIVAAINQVAQYELCFDNQMYYGNDSYNIKTSGFTIEGIEGTCFFADNVNSNSKIGDIFLFQKVTDDQINILSSSIGTVNYGTGEILIDTLNITSTSLPNNVIEVQAIPLSNDVLARKELYLQFDISNSNFIMRQDSISSGANTSGTKYSVQSSYQNGNKTR